MQCPAVAAEEELLDLKPKMNAGNVVNLATGAMSAERDVVEEEEVAPEADHRKCLTQILT